MTTSLHWISLFPSHMPLSGRDVAGFVPADQVPAQARQNQVGIYLNVILSTLVFYDAREFS